MMRKLLVLPLTLSPILTTDYINKKKYTELENKYDHTTSTLVKTTQEKEEAEAKLARIEDRVSDYNAKIRSLTDSNSKKLENLDGVVVSDEMKSKMSAALADIDQDELKDARTLKDRSEEHTSELQS